MSLSWTLMVCFEAASSRFRSLISSFRGRTIRSIASFRTSESIVLELAVAENIATELKKVKVPRVARIIKLELLNMTFRKIVLLTLCEIDKGLLLPEEAAFFVEFVLIQDRFVNIEFTLILHQKMQIDSIKECVCWIQLYSLTLKHGLLFNFPSTLQINIESTLHLKLDII